MAQRNAHVEHNVINWFLYCQTIQNVYKKKKNQLHIKLFEVKQKISSIMKM